MQFLVSTILFEFHGFMCRNLWLKDVKIGFYKVCDKILDLKFGLLITRLLKKIFCYEIVQALLTDFFSIFTNSE